MYQDTDFSGIIALAAGRECLLRCAQDALGSWLVAPAGLETAPLRAAAHSQKSVPESTITMVNATKEETFFKGKNVCLQRRQVGEQRLDGFLKNIIKHSSGGGGSFATVGEKKKRMCACSDDKSASNVSMVFACPRYA